ncbi:hypothetical protein ACFWMT_23070 [Streptomyces sp. NPDC058368]|uniref:hypothetical protein n=1 Tax=Streptomyces sp. NPDC058368 TaxID=3346461 RepID=UPI003665E082
MRNVRLDWLATEVMNELTTRARRAVQDLLTETARRPDRWPAPGGEEVAEEFGTSCWIVFVAYRDGIEVRDVGWLSCDGGVLRGHQGGGHPLPAG